MSKINHHRPELLNKDNLKKRRQMFRALDHELEAHGTDFRSPPPAHPKLCVTVIELFKLMELFVEGFNASEKVRQKASQGLPIGKRLAQSDRNFLERLDQLSLVMAPIIADIMLEILNKDIETDFSSVNWWDHTRRHIRLEKRFKLTASAEEKLFEYSLEKIMGNYQGLEEN